MNRQQGFTLLELLLVVSILAALSGITATAIGGYDQEARKQLVHSEMKSITKAIYKFKQDTGYFPREGGFENEETNAETTDDKLADLGFLFTSPKNSTVEIAPWNEVVGRGWNGPYMTAESQQRLHTLSSSSISYCDDDVITTPFIVNNNVLALSDTFETVSIYTSAESCFIIHDKGAWVPQKAVGQAYRYLTDFTNDYYSSCVESSAGCVVLLSLGPNGEFEDNTIDNCEDDDVVCDDIIKILRVN